jgi:hypothetical protein
MTTRLLLVAGALLLLPPPGEADTAAAGADGAGQPDKLEAVLRGLEARERLLETELHSYKALWTVVVQDEPAGIQAREEYLQRLSEMTSSPPDSPENAAHSPAPGIPPAERIEYLRELAEHPRRVTRSYFAMRGEAFVHSSRRISPVEDAVAVIRGSTGAVGWTCTDRCRSANPVQPLSRPGARFTGIHRLLASPEGRLSELIRAANPRLTDEEMLSGRRTYVVEHGAEPDTMQPYALEWICPDFGCAIVRSLSDSGGAASVRQRIEWECTDYQDFGRGIWLPTCVKSTKYIPGEDGEWLPLGSETAQAEYLRVNLDLPDSEFRPPRQVQR